MARKQCPYCRKSIYFSSTITKIPEKKGYDAVKEAQYKKRTINREEVYALYFIDKKKPEEIGSELGYTGHYIREIIRRVKQQTNAKWDGHKKGEN